jgi:DNA-binding protein HU-beta
MRCKLERSAQRRCFQQKFPYAGKNYRWRKKMKLRRLYSVTVVAIIHSVGKVGNAIRGDRMPSVVTKSDLVHAAARAGNLSKTAAGEAVNAVFDAIVTSVAKGNRVTVIGFGTFLPRKRKARAGRSPANGKEIKINAKTVPAFAAGQGFKDAVGDR